MFERSESLDCSLRYCCIGVVLVMSDRGTYKKWKSN